MKLIINADDYGYSRGVNWGILDAHKQGVVSSTTIMPNMPGFDHAVLLAKQTPTLGVGVHLVLTCGQALTGRNRTITDENGRFRKLDELKENILKIDRKEVEREYEAQIEKVLSSGIVPTHLDSHHHTHMLKSIFPIFLNTAQKYNLPIRLFSREVLTEEYGEVKTPDLFVNGFYGENANEEYFIEMMERFIETDDVVEVMCHPAYVDQAILSGSSYNVQRTKELEVLTSKGILDYISRKGIPLVNYKSIA